MEHYRIPLEGSKVTLPLLSAEHIQQMRALSGDADIWRWYTEDLTHPDNLEKWMTKRLEEAASGEKISYAVVLKDSNKVIGATSYGHISWAEKHLEIGWTWLGRDFIGTGINKHMKFLMLHHAFDNMDMERVELRTDENNVRSRKAMEKIGAIHDGTLRNHRSTQGGRRRNTVIYSILRDEWPVIRGTIFKEY